MKLQIPRRALSFVLLSGYMLPGSGCSYAFAHGPAKADMAAQPRGEGAAKAVTCTTSNAAPIVDTVIGSALVGFGGVIAIGSVASHHSSGAPPNTGFLIYTPTQSPASSSSDSSWEEAGIAVGAGAIGLGVLFLASAVTGYGRTADCRRLEEALPGGPHSSARYLLDLNGIVADRAREELRGNGGLVAERPAMEMRDGLTQEPRTQLSKLKEGPTSYQTTGASDAALHAVSLFHFGDGRSGACQ